MKVSNNKIGNAVGHAEASRTGKADSMKQKDSLLNGLGNSGNKAEIKDSSKLNLSDRAQMMQKAKDIASEPMGVDEARVARLQKMIDEGKYKIDADAIADRLVDEHLSIPD